MAKPYRIKHKASGLYYQPARNHSNLGKNGKVYMANSSWMKALKEYVASKNQEDGVDVKLPDIDELIKKLASDEFIEKKIKDILGDNDVDIGKEK